MTSARVSFAARCCRIVLVGALGAFCSSLHAQSAPAPAALTKSPTASQLAKYDLNKNGVLDPDERKAFEAGEGGEPILLTPFQVSTDQDRGYAAGNTLTGGRVDTPLALTPSAISIMTKEFLDDFAITDSNEAAQWTMNMDTAGNPTQGPFGGDRFESNFRGAGGQSAGSYPVRDGLQQYWIADSYNSERFEAISGPNSAQSGLGGPGGLMGSSSKRGRFNTRSGSVSTRADNFGGYRGTFDYNIGFGRVAFRVNALYQNTQAIQKYTANKQNGITLGASFKISNKTLLSVQFEKSSEWNIQYRKTWGEQASFWNRTTVNANNTALATTTGTGLSLLSQNADRLTYNFSTGSLLNYRGNQYQTSGLGYQIPWGGRPDLPQEYYGSANFKPGMGKTFFLGPIDSIADRDLNAHQVVLEHTFTPNLSVRFTWQASDVDPTVPYAFTQPSDYRIDVNRLLPDGTNNPNYLRAYSEWTPGSQHQSDMLNEYVGQLNYQFRLPRLFDLKQRFNLIAGYRFKDIDAWDRQWRRDNNPAALNPQTAANALMFRQYYGDTPGKLAAIMNQETMNKLSPGMTFGNYATTGYHSLSYRGLKYAQIVSETNFFSDRLVLSANYRKDKIFNGDMNYIGTDPANKYAVRVGALNPATGLNEEGFSSKLYSDRQSYSTGAVVYPFKGMGESGSRFRSGLFRWIAPIGLVWNYSENFQVPPSGGPFYTGERPLPPFSKTTDLALRYSIPGGVVYGEIRRYFTDNIGSLSGMSNTGDIGNIWRDLGYTESVLINFSSAGYRDTSDRGLTGTEAEIVANPTRNWTLRANYGHPRVQQIVERKLLHEYYNAHIAEWRAGANAQIGQVLNGHAVLNPVTVAQGIQNIENGFNGLTTGTIGSGPIHRGTLSSSYRFTEGRLRGLGLSGGLSWRGSSKVGSRDARLKFQTTAPTILQTTAAAFDYLYVPSQLTNNLGFNYTHRFGKYNTRFQLNITNLLNDDDPNWSSYSVINAGQLTNQSDANALTVAGSNPRMQVRSGFSQYEPRKFVFTTTVSF